MRFHTKIAVVALGFALIVAGARALPGSESALENLSDPGFWAAIGQDLIGVQDSGWCNCLQES